MSVVGDIVATVRWRKLINCRESFSRIDRQTDRQANIARGCDRSWPSLVTVAAANELLRVRGERYWASSCSMGTTRQYSVSAACLWVTTRTAGQALRLGSTQHNATHAMPCVFFTQTTQKSTQQTQRMQLTQATLRPKRKDKRGVYSCQWRRGLKTSRRGRKLHFLSDATNFRQGANKRLQMSDRRDYECSTS